ncbi:lipid A deacylase LpxR family protein [Nitrincola alkalisediminis]|uniref:lipid A deacylase LpxR family protein n=1 Tax=Nitrincola alkalisediminis TaxID=1366656 RepID=UPI001FEBE98A|nr:lipid A deacylase LpxR family protein [Nitrincola alkalisediminis]
MFRTISDQRFTSITCALLCALLAITPALNAEETDEVFDINDLAEPVVLPDNAPEIRQSWTLNLYFENDLFNNTDQQYTNGVRVSWISPDILSFVDDAQLPIWIRRVNTYLTPFDPVPFDQQQAVSRRLIFSLGQKMFTPENRLLTEVDPNDRPYAGWLYAGMGYHTRSQHKMNSFEVNLGVVGPAALAKEAQDLVHDLRGFDRFDGWDNQLKNEPGIQLVYEHKNRIARTSLFPGMEFDAIVHAGGSLGNVATYVNTGGQIRLGKNLPSDLGTSALRAGGDSSVPGFGDPRFDNQWSVHGFMSLDGRFVVRDIFLDGNTWRDSHSVDKRHTFAEASFGLAGTYERWKLSYARVYRTKQFRTQRNSHNFGSIALSYSL